MIDQTILHNPEQQAREEAAALQLRSEVDNRPDVEVMNTIPMRTSIAFTRLKPLRLSGSHLPGGIELGSLDGMASRESEVEALRTTTLKTHKGPPDHGAGVRHDAQGER